VSQTGLFRPACRGIASPCRRGTKGSGHGPMPPLASEGFATLTYSTEWSAMDSPTPKLGRLMVQLPETFDQTTSCRGSNSFRAA